MTWTSRRRSDFGPLRAIVAGAGPSVVMIHGVGLRAEAWAKQIDAMRERFRVVAVDLPGHGESPVPSPDMKLRDFSDTIASSLGSPALVVGHSMGAMIALDIAVRHRQRVQGVAALNAIFQRERAAAEAVRLRADSLDGRTVAEPEPTLTRWFGEALSSERDACKAWLRSVDPEAYRTAFSVFAREDGLAPATLATLSCPAFFMTGAKEPNSTPAMSRAMADLAPKGSVQIVDPLHPDTQIGPLCTAAQVQKIEATLDAARVGGARIRFGGTRLVRPGNYMAPTLVECPHADIATLKTEMFGPVMSLLPFDTEDEAIALANATPFGLGSGVFTQNVARAHRVSARLKAGICWSIPIVPFHLLHRSGDMANPDTDARPGSMQFWTTRGPRPRGSTRPIRRCPIHSSCVDRQQGFQGCNAAP